MKDMNALMKQAQGMQAKLQAAQARLAEAEVEGVAVVPKLASGQKCARSWRITKDVGADPAYPGLSARDAAAMREFDARAA